MTSFEEYYIKTEERIECLDDAKEDKIVFANDNVKCGEVMIGYQGEFTFICVLCMKPFIELCSFGKHITDLHLSRSTLNTFSIESDRSRDPQCEASSAISTQREPKSGFPLLVPLTASEKNQNELEIEILDTVVPPECIVNEDSRYDASSCEENIPVAISSNSSQIGEMHPELVPLQKICKYCDKEFDDSVQLATHVRTHTGRKRFVCPFCPKLFKTRDSRQSHINVHNGVRPYKCPHCPVKFAHHESLNKHKRKYHEDSRYDASSGEESTLVAKSSISSQVGEYVCKFCESSYRARSSYMRHMKYKHPERKLDQMRCKFCDKEFEDEIQLETHDCTRKGRMLRFCTYRPKVFDTRQDRQSHVNEHASSPPYKCSHCPKTFTLPNYLEKHISVHLGSDASQIDSTTVSTEKADDRDPLCAQSSISVSTQREINSESSTFVPASAPNPIQKELEIGILDTVACSDRNDNEDSRDEGSTTPVAIFLNPTKVEEFVCTVCGCGYSANDSYKKHMREMHPELVPIKNICKYCDKEFDDSVQLETHVRTHTGRKRFVCPLCPKVFKTRDSRQSHINVHNGVRPYKCPHCPVTFAHHESLNKHKRTYHKATNQKNSKQEEGVLDTAAPSDGNDNACSKDDVVRCQESPPVATFLNKVPDGEYGCGYCGRSYTARNSFKRHMKRIHPNIKDDAWVCIENECSTWEEASPATEGGELVCKICGRSYKERSSLRKHMRKQHSGKDERVPDQLSCKYCYKKFDNLIQLTTHVRTHRGRKRFICPFCPKAFYTKHIRQRHINVHTGERPYKCSLCPKAFADQTNLKKHTHAHLQIKNYACAYCDKRFVQSSERKLHERSHTGEKPYQCEECGQRFKCCALLTEHRRIHKNVRNYVCTVCSKAFFSSSRLRQHSIVHRSDRPYNCNICNKSFPRRTSLITHQQLHSNEKKYVCGICGAAFAQSAGLYSHRKSHGDKL